MRIGTIKQIWRYPVKSMAGEQLEACSVGLNGIPGDRGWAIRDDTAGETTNGKHFPLLMQCSARYREAPVNGANSHVDMWFPDGVRLGSDAPDVNARLTELLGKPVSLWSLQPASNTEHYRRRSKPLNPGPIGVPVFVQFLRRAQFCHAPPDTDPICRKHSSRDSADVRAVWGDRLDAL